MCHSLLSVTFTDYVHTYAMTWQGVHHGFPNRRNQILCGLLNFILQRKAIRTLVVIWIEQH